jgi:hypothetical protein
LLIAVLAAGLVLYSQTAAFGWDEGFHLIAAWLIALGKQPYRDFIFAQTPLNAYWNALIMRVAGAGWRGPHAAAALETAAAAGIAADYLLRQLPAASRLWIAVAAAAFIGTNIQVVQFATIGQAYGMCILMGTLAFRFAVASVEGRWWLAALSGVSAGAAAASSLLTAPLGPVIFVWLLFQRNGRRVAAYLAGAVVGLSPAILAFWLWRRQFLFGVVDFQLHYRQLDWDGWFVHDLEIVTGFLSSLQGTILLGLALAGILVSRGRKDLTLCCWIAAVSTLYLAATHPTFPQYFIVEVPFAAILAAAGLQALFDRYPRRWPALVAAGLTAASFGRQQWEERDDTSWADLTEVAKTVSSVLKPGTRLYAEEQIYLLTGRTPPPGMEWTGSHKIRMRLGQAEPFHVLPQPEVDRQIRHGDFPVLETCEAADVSRLGLETLYREEKKVRDCFVFSDFKKP